MANLATTISLFHFHLLERHLFSRLTGPLGRPVMLAKMVVAVWLFFEESGFYNLIRKIYANFDPVVEAIFDETASCLQCMDPSNNAQPTGIDDTPLLARILEEPMNRRFFHFNRNLLLNRVSRIKNTVCDVIFNENTTQRVEDHLVHRVLRGFGEGSSLNPFAREFTVGEQRISPDERSMFLTFSNGYPLSREEIIHFFTANWGPVVEGVMMEHTSDANNPPQYGRIVFTNPSVIDIILNGQPKAKFVVNKRHLWARAFEPRGN